MIDTLPIATRSLRGGDTPPILVMIPASRFYPIVTVLTYTMLHPSPSRSGWTGVWCLPEPTSNMGQAVFLKYGLMEHGSLWGHAGTST